MASSYLDLYTGAGGLRQRNILGMSSPYQRPQFSFGTPQNVFYQAGATEKVVHDTLNNKYYGTQKQSDLVKGLEESIKRTQKQLTERGESRYSTGWMGALNTSYYRYTAKDREAQNAQIASQQKYLDNINNGMYKQEANTFFDSYDDWTGDWNNVFKKRYDNSVIEAKNVKTTARNEKITKLNQRNKRINSELNQQDTTKSSAVASPISPKLEVNTGLASEKTKNRSKANAILVDNGLNI